MASTAVALQLRRRHRTMQKPAYVHFFSSSSSESNMEDQNTTPSSPSPSQPQFSSSSYFSDVKASLRQNPPRQLQQRQSRHPFPLSTPPSSQATSKVASLAEIRKNLAEFPTRSSSPPAVDRSSSPPPLQGPVSFQEPYKRNVMSTGQDSSNGASKGGGLSFDAIRESLRKLRSNATKNQADNSDPMSLKNFKESLKLRPSDPNAREPTVVLGGTGNLPRSVFEKELQEKAAPESLAMKTMFLSIYSFNDLGTKLRALRPEAKQGNWFSLGELNERLNKLREMDKKEQQSGIGGTYMDLRNSLAQLHTSDEENKMKKQTNQRLDFLGQFGRTPDFMLAPPKENLVEKYFHPDNMSSSEKLNLELQKVRDQFKMSESDCGSARVQVAQLTTKIKHLSTVLHKKDKHSRKGLQEMVERRKKLLTYLRRTDWDSYCLVLSKFGLRDNPDFLKVDPNYNKIIKSKKKKPKKKKSKA